MTDFLDKLIAKAEGAMGNEGKKDTNPIATLSRKELRKRFNEYGEPLEGFDIDGNPIPTGEEK